MRKTLWLSLVAVVLALAIAGCRQQPAAWEAMVAFDQAYIPALALTSQQQGAAARAVMPQAVARWQVLQDRVPAGWTRQSAWRQAAADVTGRLQRADALIAAGHLLEAHEELEAVRELLLAQRQQHGIDYFVDRLTAYHEPMEAIVLAVKDKTAATLADDDIDAVRQHLRNAQARWAAVEQARVDPARYGLSEEKAMALQAGIAKEAAALQALQAALAQGDRQRIITAGTAIKPPFAQLFMLFGDFTLANASAGASGSFGTTEQLAVIR